jgi:hypothetical protein
MLSRVRRMILHLFIILQPANAVEGSARLIISCGPRNADGILTKMYKMEYKVFLLRMVQ